MNNPNQKQINDIIKNGAKKEDINKLIGSLNAEDAKKLNQLLNDKEATQQLLNRPDVKELIKKMFGDGKNG